MSVQVQIGADVTQFDAVVATLPDKVARSSQQMTRANGGLMRSLGGVSMQVQDIAVQLQMGTSVTRVLAQQGSQLLSAFGAGGAIAGGVIAIGGAFFTMAENAKKAFADAEAAETAFFTKLNRDLVGADVSSLAQSLETVVDRRSSKQMDLNKVAAGGTLTDAIAQVFGGPSLSERMQQAEEQAFAAAEARQRIESQIASVAIQEIQVSRMRIAGEKEKADEMQRQLDLARELARIGGLNISDTTRGLLSTAAIARSEAGKPVVPTGPNLLGRVTGFFGAAMTQMAPTIDAISNRFKERAQQSLSRTQAFAGALGGLRGDMDTSTGRSAFNPLRADGSKQLSEMARQTAALRRVAQTGDKQTSLLQSIDATIRRLNLIPKYS
jgi:hypothetical protein